MNYIIGNMSSMVLGPYMDSGNNSENYSSRMIFGKPTTNIDIYSHRERDKQSYLSEKKDYQVDFLNREMTPKVKLSAQTSSLVRKKSMIMKGSL